MARRNPRQQLDPKAARVEGVDAKGNLWVDGNAKGIRSAVATDNFREGWERVFGKNKRKVCA